MFPKSYLFFNPNRKRRCVRAGYFLLLTIVAAALLLSINASLASEDTVPSYQLHVKPSICVSYDSTQPCTMAMNVTWEGESLGNVCLRGAMISPTLFCWKNAKKGSIALDYANTSDMVYQLVEEASQGVLAEAQVKVINRDLRSSRKRRRHVWSIL